MKLCEKCQGSGNKFWIKDGKPHWETCQPCNGTGVTIPFSDDTDVVPLEGWLAEYEARGGWRV